MSKYFLQAYISKIIRAESSYREKLNEQLNEPSSSDAQVDANPAISEATTKVDEAAVQTTLIDEGDGSKLEISSNNKLSIDDIVPDIDVDLEDIIKTCESSYQFNELIDVIIDTNIKLPPDTFLRVMNLLGKAGYVHEVIHLMIIMRNRGVMLIISYFKILMEILYQHGQWEGCYR